MSKFQENKHTPVTTTLYKAYWFPCFLFVKLYFLENRYYWTYSWIEYILQEGCDLF